MKNIYEEYREAIKAANLRLISQLRDKAKQLNQGSTDFDIEYDMEMDDYMARINYLTGIIMTLDKEKKNAIY